MNLAQIRQAIQDDPLNASYTAAGHQPLYAAHPEARIVIIGQAPGKKAQDTRLPWNDASGNTLRDWLGMSREVFYDVTKVAHLPMDFYFPGSTKSGDAPPRKEFAPLWHPLLLEQMPHIQLTILIGAYSQRRYLGEKLKESLTETVRAYREYLPEYLPLVHPSPRNNIWMKKNPWFKADVVPVLQERVRAVLLG